MINVFRPSSYRGVDCSACQTLANHKNERELTIEGLTRDVEVKPLHSHNDYWRRHPLFDALEQGCQSIESDVWVFAKGYEMERTSTESTSNSGSSNNNNNNNNSNDNKKQDIVERQEFSNNEIYVGHNHIYLHPENTLNKLYLDPLFRFLEYSNPKLSYQDENNHQEPIDLGFKNGIFYNSPESPLYFWLDIKIEPERTYEAVKTQLTRFIEKGYLAHYDTKEDVYVPGPIVVTLTGEVPVELVERETVRYVFVDAPLQDFKLSSKRAQLDKYSKLSVIASASLQQLLGEEDYQLAKHGDFLPQQKQKLKSYIDEAHKHKLKTRIWGGITWPHYIRDMHLKALWSLDCDLLNVDDVKSAGQDF